MHHNNNPNINNTQNSIKILHWNCNSIHNKIEKLGEEIKNKRLDIILLNEIKQNKESCNYTFNKMKDKLNTIFKVRSENSGGGVAIMIKNTLKY
jgi:exonuclease III